MEPVPYFLSISAPPVLVRPARSALPLPTRNVGVALIIWMPRWAMGDNRALSRRGVATKGVRPGRPRNQVRWIATRPMGALRPGDRALRCMAVVINNHTLFNLAVDHLVDDAMGISDNTPAYIDLAIPLTRAGQPRPAIVCTTNIDLHPDSIFNRKPRSGH